MVFPDVIFFSLLSFFQALASHLDQRIHISEEREKEKERKKKAKGKGNKNERKRNGKGNEKGQEKRKGKRTGKRKGEGKGRVKEETGKRKGKGRGKGKKRQCLTRTIFDAKSYRFRCRFVIVREACVSFFFWKWLQSSKKECSDHLPGTFLAQNLRHYNNKQ